MMVFILQKKSMKINDFKMKVTYSQSKIVQEILFANGYFWNYSSSTIKNLYYSYLFLETHDGVTKIRCSDDYNVFKYETSYKELTFNEFLNRYSLKEIRRKKLEKLVQYEKSGD